MAGKPTPELTPEGATATFRLGRWLAAALILVSLSSIAAAWWYYTAQKREMRAAVTRTLFGVARVQADQIANWRRERLGDGGVVSSSSVMRLLQGTLEGRAGATNDRADLLDLMSRLSQSFHYTDATLVDLDGHSIVRLRSDTTDSAAFKQRTRRELVQEAIESHDAVLSDLRADSRSGRPLMALTIPVSGLGGLILDIDPTRFLYPYLEAWPGQNLTGETLLVRLEGQEIVSLNRARNAPDLPVFSRRPLNISLPPESVLAAGWTRTSTDYRRVPVIGTVRRVPDSPWFVICKVDLAELEAPLRRLGWEMVLVTGLICLANTAGVGLIWRGQQAQAHRDKEAWFYAVANDTPAYLWMTSRAREDAFINQPFARFLGIELNSPQKDWIAYVHPDDAARAHRRLLECFAAHASYCDEFRVRRYDGEYRWVTSEAVPRFSTPGSFVGFAGSLLDITERREAEEQLHALSARLITVQEEERKRLARELHDDLNQQIAAVSIAVGNLKRQIGNQPEEARTHSDRIHQRLAEIAEVVRRMSHDLHPATLQYCSLPVALQAYCDEFRSLTGVTVSLGVDASFPQVPPSTALCLYRITQEALRNIARHAKVSEARVELLHGDDFVRLEVVDRGAGMQLAAARTNGGLGLVSIQERTRLAGGRLELQSHPDQGTRVAVTLPLLPA